MEVKASQAISMIETCIQAKLVPMLRGSPGCGKSDITHGIGKSHNLKVIDLRMAQADPTDCNGFPTIYEVPMVDNEGKAMLNAEGQQRVHKKAGYIPMDTFPLEGDPIPPGYDGWLLFMDEFTSASPAVQAAAYKIILDRGIGLHKLHKKVAIVCAGNKESDNAIVVPMSTAMTSRLVHLELVVDHEEWIKWATLNGIDTRIMAYINWKPDMLYNFIPDKTDDTYASPRTWEFANRLLGLTSNNASDRRALLAGTIGEGAALEFLTFCDIYRDLIKIEDIVANPTLVAVPTGPDVLWAICGSVANHATIKNVDPIVTFIRRMPAEFQIVCLREMIRRNQDLMQTASLQTWLAEESDNLF